MRYNAAMVLDGGDESGDTTVRLEAPRAVRTDVVLIGLESVGKSAIFRRLSRGRSGDEQNFRGSTVSCRSAPVPGTDYRVVDTPGARFDVDAETTELALRMAHETAIVVVVARATQAAEELARLFPLLAPTSAQRVALVLTHIDKLSSQAAARCPEHLAGCLGVPVVALDARGDDAAVRARVIDAVERAVPFDASRALPPQPLAAHDFERPRRSVLDQGSIGPMLALALTLAMFALPRSWRTVFRAGKHGVNPGASLGYRVDVRPENSGQVHQGHDEWRLYGWGR